MALAEDGRGGGIPTSLIRQVQISLREEAGVPSSYHSCDPALLFNHSSSLSEVLEKFEPSIPSYLRCKQCRGPLLRGLQSIVCVFCGAQQRKEISPDPIPFKSTFSYNWLLQSLDLNGSEAVGLATGDIGSTKEREAPKNELVLSDLFDLEIKWPTDVEKSENVIDNKASFQSRSSLNLAGVDLDSFFTETTKETATISKEPSISNKDTTSTATREVPSQESLSLFENAQASSAVRVSPTEDTGWDAEFQSASSGTPLGDSKSQDPFVPNTDIEFKKSSVHSDVETKNDLFPSVSIGEPKGNSNKPSISSGSWMQDNLWPSGNNKMSNKEKFNSNDDSFDPWKDFASSGNAQDTNDRTVSSEQQASDIYLMSSGSKVQEMEFDNFKQPDLFSGVSGSDNGSTNVNLDKTSISDRIEAVGVETGHDDILEPTSQKDSANSNVVESIMSQMHDLSFMLDSDLSIPKTKQG